MASTPTPTHTHTATDGRTYTLLSKTVVLPGGRRQPVYWFARRPAPGATPAALPPGWRVVESPLTGRPYLRKA